MRGGRLGVQRKGFGVPPTQGLLLSKVRTRVRIGNSANATSQQGIYFMVGGTGIEPVAPAV
jgi:hypothetical protein